MPWKHGAHSTYDLQYHLIFTTKYRRHVLHGPVSETAQSVFQKATAFHHISVESLKCGGDHLHALVSAPPSLAPATMVRALKSYVARTLFHRFPALHQIYWGGEFSGGWLLHPVRR